MDKFQLQKLRDLPIEGVAERLGLRVCRHKSLCPFHDDHHASLSFSVARNTFRCWSCGESGGTISLAEKMLGKGFLEACRWLANENNVILTGSEFLTMESRPKNPAYARNKNCLIIGDNVIIGLSPSDFRKRGSHGGLVHICLRR